MVDIMQVATVLITEAGITLIKGLQILTEDIEDDKINYIGTLWQTTTISIIFKVLTKLKPFATL
jgi:hypothetical protein